MSSTEVQLVEGVSRDFLLHHRLCPRELAPDGTLVVAAAEGALLDGLDELSFAYGRPVVTEPAILADVERMVERLATRSDRLIELAQVHDGPSRPGEARLRKRATRRATCSAPHPAVARSRASSRFPARTAPPSTTRGCRWSVSAGSGA